MCSWCSTFAAISPTSCALPRKRRGAEIILITDIYLSPVATVADHVVSIRTDGLSSWESMTSLSALVETIMTYLSIARWSEIKARIERMESIRSYLEGSSDPL